MKHLQVLHLQVYLRTVTLPGVTVAGNLACSTNSIPCGNASTSGPYIFSKLHHSKEAGGG